MGKPRFWTPEEDALLKELAGKVNAREIGMILGRSRGSVNHRVNHLGLNGRLWGERHWSAKLDNLTRGMIGALYDAGYTAAEIHKVLTTTIDISDHRVSSICYQRKKMSDASHAAERCSS